MRQIKIITSENNQKMNSVSDGILFDMNLTFVSTQQCWFASFVTENKTINNIRIFNSGNILHQFRNILNFGIKCEVIDGGEPMFLDDFSSQRCRMFVLTKSETENYAGIISGQIST